jgi:hypothetical protein
MQPGGGVLPAIAARRAAVVSLAAMVRPRAKKPNRAPRPGVEDHRRDVDEADRDGDAGAVGDPQLVPAVDGQPLGPVGGDRPIVVAVGVVLARRRRASGWRSCPPIERLISLRSTATPWSRSAARTRRQPWASESSYGFPMICSRLKR